MNAGEFEPALTALRQRLTESERKSADIRRAINTLLEAAGRPPEFADDEPDQPNKIAQIRDDTFYGKKMQTAAREYLEMRKAQGIGPAKPRDIFDALTAGGFRFETKDDHVALVSLRAMLRKRTAVFHQLPNGAYGLLKWYPDVKPTKPGEADDVGETEFDAADGEK